jgi:RecA/RadA recombinase
MAKIFDFISSFEKDLSKMDGIGTSSSPPRYWYSTGNYVLNRIISGSFTKGIPQGRITDLAGPAGAGKSFIAANLVAAAQREGASILIVDSENALDDEFMSKIGVDVDREDYLYAGVSTIPEASRVVSSFLKGYKDSVGEDTDAPQVLILIDSLDMLMTETEAEHFDKGVTKGDQGQKNKQLKAMLRTFVQAIKTLNVAIICTSQVYKNQDLMNGEGVWIVSDAVRYAASQIVLIQKRKLKDDSKGAKIGDFAGVRMICEGYKTRFTKPFQKVEIEVPYETGMDATSGLLEAALNAGVVVKKGSWYTLAGVDENWRGDDIGQKADEIIKRLEAITDVFLAADGEIDTTDSGVSAKALRKAKFDVTKDTLPSVYPADDS